VRAIRGEQMLQRVHNLRAYDQHRSRPQSYTQSNNGDGKYSV
jgi:hypothetical protein